VHSLADKLLGRPELITRLREHIGDRLVMVEPWNVTESEVAVAEQLQAPINGMDPALRHLGLKSVGLRIFVEAGVPVPYGREDVRTVGDVVAVVGAIQAARPDVRTVVASTMTAVRATETSCTTFDSRMARLLALTPSAAG
jgi:hypothetical protein